MAKTAGFLCLAAVAALALVAAAVAATPAKLRLLPDEAARGRPDAPVTVVEFTDYQCPFCKRFEAETWPQLKRNYVDTGKVRFIVRDLPLEFHDSALPAAEAAHCAGEQGKFWPMHDALIAKGSDLSAGGIQGQAGRLALDLPRFQACVAQHRYAKDILRNAALAHSLGLEGTPAFVIGRVHDGELAGVSGMGAQPYENFAEQIEEELAAARAGK
jgi:protein-disulfide isomerase